MSDCGRSLRPHPSSSAGNGIPGPRATSRGRAPKAGAFRFAAWLVVSTLFFSPAARADSQQTYLDALVDFERYAETSLWVDAGGSQPPDSGYWGDGGSTGNGGIRGSCGVAVAYAVLVQAMPGNPTNTTRLLRIRKALNYAANTHVTGAYNTVNGNKWGWSGVSTDWQTPEWSASMALACILVQSNLPADTVDAVRRVVVSEANHRAGIAPASGYVSDTKAEENAWQGNILALAAAWMSTSNNAPAWLDAAKSYLVNSYTVPDTTGDPLAAWVTTQTLYPSYALENHGFYHPTYEMVAGMSSGDSLLMAQLANSNVADELEPFADHNVMNVWSNNLRSMVMETGELAYPASLDWSLHDYEHNSYITWMRTRFNDPLARWADERLAQLVRYRQLVNGDGRFVGPALSGGFYREAVEARRTAIAWLHLANADYPSGPTNAPPDDIAHFSDVKILSHRTAAGFVSVSYGPRIMGWIEPASASMPSNTFISTPSLPGIFGHGPLGNPTSAALINLVTNAGGFSLELLLQNGANGSTRVYVKTTGDSVGVVEIPLPANGVTGTGAGCFTNGIQNDPLTGGRRLVEWTGNSATFTNFSGVARNITNSWVCVAGRHGMAVGPGGYFRYRTASGYNSTFNAAADLLHHMPQTRLGARYAVWFLGKNAAQTAALAGQISWTTNGSTVSLTFPGPGGAPNTIIASLVTSNGTWIADANGNWSDPAKWTNGVVADGVGNTADFSAINLSADRTVTLDSSRAIGNLRFGDTAGLQNWFLSASGANTLTLAGSPAIVVNQNSATIHAPLAGTGGFTKSGPGTLVLAGTNTLSGTLFLDSNSTSANDGAVRITTSAALANVTSLSIRNNTGPAAASTLQLDGSSGNLVVTQDLTASCRANLIPTIANLAGSNTFSGAIFMNVGGSNIVIRADSGTLALTGTLQYIGSLTAARFWNFFGDGDTLVSSPILFSAVAPIGVGKYGNGTLTLDGNNTCTGPTTIFNGTLRGNGAIAGPVTVLPGATLSPGTSVGTLAIYNSLTNSGTLLFELNKTGATLTNDLLEGMSTIVYGGTLQLSVVGEPLSLGDSFKLFDAADYLGSFASIVPESPGTGLVWDTNNLAINGTLAVALGAVHPQITQIVRAGDHIIWSGTGGAASSGFTVLLSTNLALPFQNWTVVGTGRFDLNGNFTVTNGPVTQWPQAFHVLRIP